MKVSARNISLIAVFASLHAVLYVMSIDLWRNWGIYLEPFEGIILGPWAGFIAALLGSAAGRMIKPTDLWIFGIIAEPLAALGAGFLSKKKWKPLVAIFAFMMGAYFLHPYGRWFPLWTIADVLLASVLIYPITRIFESPSREKAKKLSFMIPLIAFVGTAMDALTRIFLLIPGGLSGVFFGSPEAVYSIFVLGAVDSYIEDMLVVIVSIIIGVPLTLSLRRVPTFKFPAS